jgi:hypothetical protein
LDVVFVGEKENGDLEVVSYKNGTTFDVVFPNKLKDLKGYKVSFIDEFPGIFTEKTGTNSMTLSGINLKHIHAMTKHQRRYKPTASTDYQTRKNASLKP